MLLYFDKFRSLIEQCQVIKMVVVHLPETYSPQNRPVKNRTNSAVLPDDLAPIMPIRKLTVLDDCEELSPKIVFEIDLRIDGNGRVNDGLRCSRLLLVTELRRL